MHRFRLWQHMRAVDVTRVTTPMQAIAKRARVALSVVLHCLSWPPLCATLAVMNLDVDNLLKLERRVWDALVEGDVEADTELLAEDFVGVYPTGFANRSDHVAQLSDGPSVSSYVLSEPRRLHVSDRAVMLSYRADFHRVSDVGDEPPEVMYISSLWCQRGDRWVNTFSQDTPSKF